MFLHEEELARSLVYNILINLSILDHKYKVPTLRDEAMLAAKGNGI